MAFVPVVILLNEAIQDKQVEHHTTQKTEGNKDVLECVFILYKKKKNALRSSILRILEMFPDSFVMQKGKAVHAHMHPKHYIMQLLSTQCFLRFTHLLHHSPYSTVTLLPFSHTPPPPDASHSEKSHRRWKWCVYIQR